jgi:putative copper export protein
MTTVLALHLMAAAVWGGGVVFLGVAAGVARRTIPDAERIEFFRAIGRRFLYLSGLAAITLLATGASLAHDRMGSLDLLGTGSDGKTIFAKTVAFAAVLVLATVHGLILGPRIRTLRQDALAAPGDEARASRLRSTLIASGITSALMLAGTIAIFVLAARLG